MSLQHLRSSTANKRPVPGNMSDGQIAINTNTGSPGLFFKDSNSTLVKVGPVHVGTTAPNASPANGGTAGNSVGEQWLDTSGGTYVFKVWDGSAWRSESGTFVDVNGDVMTGALGIIAGTQAAPGLYFSGDTNTGLYSPGADQVAISTGGSGRLFVDASGNVTVDTNTFYVDATNNRVGIGTTSPAEALVVEGKVWVGNTSAEPASTSDRGDITITNDTGPADILFLDRGLAATRIGVDTGDSGNFKFVTDKEFIWRTGGTSYSAFNTGSERLRITSDGTVNIKGAGTAGVTQAVSFNGSAPVDSLVLTSGGLVGVGTSSPGALLHVAGNTDNNVQSILAAGNDSNFRLVSINRSAANVSGSELARFGIRYATGTDDSSGVQFFRGNTAAEGHLGLYTGGTTRLYVQGTTGNVGIGTTAPGRKLTASADASVDTAIQTTTSVAGSYIQFTDSTASSYIGTNSGSIVFLNPTTERARIDSSGRLLVGTSSARETNTGNDPFVQFERSSGSALVLSATKNGADAFGPYFTLIKSRGTSAGANNLVSSGDELGSILFYGTDGTNPEAGAAIQAYVDGTPGANDMPGRLVFSTTEDGASSPTERMRITNAGYSKHSNTGVYNSSTGTYHEFRSDASSSAPVVVDSTNTSYAGNGTTLQVYRAANSAYRFLTSTSDAGGTPDTEFVLRGDGNAFADGTWSGGGADYAEFFEWSDSNPNAEDRRGISVVLDGDKIREAVAGEDPIGVISGNPSVVGDAAWNKWSGKYLRDEYGTYIQEDYEVEDKDGNTVIQQRRKLNPAYDPDVEYVSREERPEWDCVGLMGKLRIRKGQITGSRWIKMRDISDSVEEWLVR